MSLKYVTPGEDAPEVCYVIIEIAASGDPVKYEVSKDHGMLCVDRFLSTSMRYPCNYGYIPQTLAADGDPVDVLVVAPFPLMPGTVILVRPIGVLVMEDEAGQDHKVLSVPVDSLTPMYTYVERPEDLPQTLLQKIVHFFEHYKDLEPNKWVKVVGWKGADEAREIITQSLANYPGDQNK